MMKQRMMSAAVAFSNRFLPNIVFQLRGAYRFYLKCQSIKKASDDLVLMTVGRRAGVVPRGAWVEHYRLVFPCYVWVFRAKRFLADFYWALKERFGFGVVAHEVV